jgi:hypothetical protein
MAMLTAAIGQGLDRSGEVGRRLLDWPGRPDAGSDNVALRLCGGLHSLVRKGAAPELADCYAPNPIPGRAVLWAAVEEALHDHEAELLNWLDSAPQTNEVGRSAVLMAGLLAIGDRFGQPMRTFELGASAGLNMLLDSYCYELGGRKAGDPLAPLRLAPDWSGPPPPDSPIRIIGRAGVDLRPRDPVLDGERLLAYVWPDQPERLAQLEAALSIARKSPPTVDQGDAADWLEPRLGEQAEAGTTRVVLHSIAYQYFPPDTQARILAAMAAAGAESSKASPLAWLRFEMVPGDDKPSLRLICWPGGEDRLLAWCHPHGKSVRWLAD